MSTPLVVSVTDELIAELEAMAKLATPGPWVSRIEHDSPSFQGYYVSNYGVGMYAALGTSNQDEIDASFIATANPATILALLAERAELKRDAERLEWLISEQCIVESQNGMNSQAVYRLFWRHLGECQAEWYPSERAAIDAAMQPEAKP